MNTPLACAGLLFLLAGNALEVFLVSAGLSREEFEQRRLQRGQPSLDRALAQYAGVRAPLTLLGGSLLAIAMML